MKIYFDLDGTLLDVYERYWGIFNLYLKRKNLEISLKDYKRLRQSGYSDIRIMKEKLELQVSDGEFKTFKSERLECREWLMKDSLIGDLKAIKECNCYKAIITQRRNKEEAYSQIEKLGLVKIFNDIIILSPISGRNSKYEYLKDKVSCEDYIIGDSIIELDCARRLGMKGYFVKTGLFGEQIAEPDEIRENYLECLDEIFYKREE